MKKFLIKNNRGFTMIELLVVLAIAAIVAAMALPIYANINNNIEDTKLRDSARAIANAINFELTAANTDKLRKNDIDKELKSSGKNGYSYIIKNQKSNSLGAINNLSKLLFDKVEASSAISDEILKDGYFMIKLKNDGGSILVQECYFTKDEQVAKTLFIDGATITETQIANNKLGVYKR